MFKISEPYLLIDKYKAKKNLSRMMNKLNVDQVFRPHFKTPQSLDISEWYQEEGIQAITVSSVGMAEYLSHKWDDILIAFPTNIWDIEKISALSHACRLSLIANNPKVVAELAKSLKGVVSIWIEIDTGSNRSGISPQNHSDIKDIMNVIDGADNIQLEGFYSHAGHTYQAENKEQVRSIFSESKRQLLQLKEDFSSWKSTLKINMGDTPGCSLTDNWSNIDSISAGNFIFYDLMQVGIGSCNDDDIAVCLVCPVLDIYPERGEIIVKGGGIHLSKDSMMVGAEKSYGRPVLIREDGWSSPLDSGNVRAISQEHGVLKLPADVMESISLGDSIGILPVHSCMTAECMGAYRTLTGEKVDHFAQKRFAIQ